MAAAPGVDLPARLDQPGKLMYDVYVIRKEKERLMRVAVSLDDQTLVTAYPDSKATKALRKLTAGNTNWFDDRCLEWEVRK